MILFQVEGPNESNRRPRAKKADLVASKESIVGLCVIHRLGVRPFANENKARVKPTVLNTTIDDPYAGRASAGQMQTDDGRLSRQYKRRLAELERRRNNLISLKSIRMQNRETIRSVQTNESKRLKCFCLFVSNQAYRFKWQKSEHDINEQQLRMSHTQIKGNVLMVVWRD